MISRMFSACVFAALLSIGNASWAETYSGQVAGVGEVDVELLVRGTPKFRGGPSPMVSVGP